MKKHLYALIFIVVIIGGCSNQTSQQTVVIVSAASSLSDVLQAIAKQFQKDYPAIHIQFNFGASGSLKEQIEQGAPVDLFISASTDKYEQLVEQQYVHNSVNVARNELVLITSTDTNLKLHSFQDLPHADLDKIAIGTPAVVPAGTYGKQALIYYNIWDTIEDKMVYAKDVRQVLTYVETNNVQAGIVYKTDALASEQIRIVETADMRSHDDIVYPAGVVSDTDASEEANEFLQYLKSDKAKEIWERYGFLME